MKSSFLLNSRLCAILVMSVILPSCAKALDGDLQNPVEIGHVQWGRDVDAGLLTSKTTGKPLFLLFQEVPGCSGCQKFGQEVLSEPTLVKVIENHFIPVFVANNQPGKDATTLKRFKEPAWNYQVVRFLDATATDLVPRKDGVWTVKPLAQRMVEALEKAGRKTPRELRILAGMKTAMTEKAAFAQYCFWTGEMKFGQMEGVVTTEAGFYDGHEVTLVEFDPSILPFDELVKKATAVQCADRVYVSTQEQKILAKKAGHGQASELRAGYRAASDSDQKKQLQGTPFAKLELTLEQATKANAYARSQPARALKYLTPEQVKLLR